MDDLHFQVNIVEKSSGETIFACGDDWERVLKPEHPLHPKHSSTTKCSGSSSAIPCSLLDLKDCYGQASINGTQLGRVSGFSGLRPSVIGMAMGTCPLRMYWKGDAFMEDATIVIKKGKIQDLQDPLLEKERPSCGSETKIPRISKESSGAFTPQPNFVSCRNEDRARPSFVDAYGSSTPLSLRPISTLRLNEDRVGPEIEDACSMGHSADTIPTEGETKSNKKKWGQK
ncbi:hypothetical protein Ancab_007951 [Ancistrocladus abbreviatus]